MSKCFQESNACKKKYSIKQLLLFVWGISENFCDNNEALTRFCNFGFRSKSHAMIINVLRQKKLLALPLFILTSACNSRYLSFK